MTKVDYAATYFKYPVPSLINGEPTNKTVKRLNTEVHANGSSVDTDLGGVNQGYLVIILANQEYLRINQTLAQFEAPTWSGALVVDPATTVIEAVHEKGMTQRAHTRISSV